MQKLLVGGEWNGSEGRALRVQHACRNTCLGQREREWEESSVTGLLGLWHPWSHRFSETRTGSHPDVSCYIFPHQSLLGNFRGISHHSVPPASLVTLWKPGAYSFVPYLQRQPLSILAHFLKTQIPQATLALRIYCLKNHWHTERKGRPPQNGRLLFLSRFLCKSSGQRGGALPVRADSVGLSGRGLRKRARRLVSRAILALLYFNKHMIDPFISSFSIYLTRGAQRATLTHQVDLFSHHHLSSKVTVSGKWCWPFALPGTQARGHAMNRVKEALTLEPYLALP